MSTSQFLNYYIYLFFLFAVFFEALKKNVKILTERDLLGSNHRLSNQTELFHGISAFAVI
jgi:hypothetical protein